MKKIILVAIVLYLISTLITEADKSENYYQHQPKELPVPGNY